MTTDGCCGQAGRRSRRRPPPAPLPDNPRPPGGVRMIYLGAGAATVRGERSGLTYFLADHRRHFLAHPDDVSQITHSRDFIVEP